jgi:hypothetical protein
MGVEDIEQRCRTSPQNVRFADLHQLCVHYFGDPRRSGGSHHIFKTPWQGDPRINIQDDHGKAKKYQVDQVIRAIDRLKAKDEDEEDSNNAH